MRDATLSAGHIHDGRMSDAFFESSGGFKCDSSCTVVFRTSRACL